MAKRVGNSEHRIMLEHMADTGERIAGDIESSDGSGRKP